MGWVQKIKIKIKIKIKKKKKDGHVDEWNLFSLAPATKNDLAFHLKLHVIYLDEESVHMAAIGLRCLWMWRRYRAVFLNICESAAR